MINYPCGWFDVEQLSATTIIYLILSYFSVVLNVVRQSTHTPQKMIHWMNQLDEMVSIMGKGDKPRPGTYSQEYRDNWDRIFNKKKKKENKNASKNSSK